MMNRKFLCFMAVVAAIAAARYLYMWNRFDLKGHDDTRDNIASNLLHTHLIERFPIGSDIDDVSSYLESLGASCEISKSRPEVLYCHEDHYMRWEKFTVLFIPFFIVEWKIFLWHSNDANTLAKIEVRRGSTGL